MPSLGEVEKKKDPVIETENVDKSPVNQDTSVDKSQAEASSDLRKKKPKNSKQKISLDEFQSLDQYRVTMADLK